MTDDVSPDWKAELQVVLSFLDDARRIIEGGKGRRWEAFKWIFALNLVILSAVLVGPGKLTQWPLVGLWLASAATSFMGGMLIIHYDRRMKSARDRANNLYAWLRSHVLDVHTVMGELRPIPPEQKDLAENTFYLVSIGASLVAVSIGIASRWP